MTQTNFCHKLSSVSQSVQSLSRVLLSATPWTAARRASLSITSSEFTQNSRPSRQWCHPAMIKLSSLPRIPRRACLSFLKMVYSSLRALLPSYSFTLTLKHCIVPANIFNTICPTPNVLLLQNVRTDTLLEMQCYSFVFFFLSTSFGYKACLKFCKLTFKGNF